ncbi:porin family protein [Psychroflexus halocasei]|uniref:Outer membrane protein W n=1 Tax=Psychroflexus halocasei TaxID=908615 RepID=A0A1H3Y9S5_9FLAO|nr:porin family protein [Psychroflexus halocasei]SEA08300.1 Outer membrane protein W [Psychroflexus halocasei]
MKKTLLITALSLIGIFSSNAQDKGDFELGFGVGLNISNVSTIDNQDNASSLISFNAGASGEYYFSDRWGVKAKLIYDRKGWSDGFITDENMISLTTDFKVDYVTLPIMANWHFGKNRNWYLNFGPYVGFLVKAEDSELGIDFKDGFKSNDFGLAYGIGYKFEINESIKLYVEYDGQAGLTDIFEENEGSTIRNGRSSFNVGLLYSL